jgi:hypothetical protein
MIWNEDHILEVAANGLEHESSKLDAEHAVRGIDALAETELRDRIKESLTAADIQAVQEYRYPQAQTIERLNHGSRCDLVLFPSNASLDLNNPADWSGVGYWHL